MALGTTDITTAAVKTEIGSASNQISVLVGAAGLNKYSRYAPGTLSVDGSQNIVLTPPTSNFKLGDFRSYNHTAPAPYVTTGTTFYFGPGAGNCDFSMTWRPEGLNIAAFSQNGIDSGTTPAHYHVTIKLYSDPTDRINRTNALASGTFGIDMVSHTPLVGHSRSSQMSVNYVPDTAEPGNVDRATSQPCKLTISRSGDQTVYGEIFISDISGNPLINWGTSVSANYFTFYSHERVNPYLYRSGNITPVPSGYTGAWIEVTDNSTLCNTGSNITQTYGLSSFSFYARIRSMYGSQPRVIEQSSCTVTLTLRGDAQTVYSSPLNYSGSATQITGTLSNGKTWQYDDKAVITCTASFPTTPLYTTC